VAAKWQVGDWIAALEEKSAVDSEVLFVKERLSVMV
jgi:hypothetical protein